MKHIRMTLFIVLAVSLSLLSVAVKAGDLLLKDRQLMITLGNSITQSGEQPGGYVDIMRKVLDTLYPERTIYIVNSGISGHKSTDMSERFQRDVLQYHPDWLTISVGINDVWHGFYDNHPGGDGPRGVPLDVFTTKVTDMVKRAQAAGTKVAMFTTTIIKENLSSAENKKLAGYNKALRKIARKYKCLLVDQNKVFQRALRPHQKPGMADRGILTNDGVHMLPEGNWLMAKTVLMAFGVPEERIDLIRPEIDKQIKESWQKHGKRLARYQEVNAEVGLPREGEKRVVFYGSSSVDGWNLATAFPGKPFLNRGIGGETTREMVARFRQDVLKLKPYAVILFYGSCNDFWPGNHMPPAETKSNTIKMARMAEKAGIKVAIGAISPTNDYIPGKDIVSSHPIEQVQALNAWMKAYCDAHNYVFVDFYTPVADEHGKLKAEYTRDGMHCNAAGYEQWNPEVVKALKQMGAWPGD